MARVSRRALLVNVLSANEIFIDLSRAFDMVYHCHMQKLQGFGVTGAVYVC